MSHLTPAWQRRVRFCSEKCHISYLTPAWQPRVRCEISPIASHSSQAAWSEGQISPTASHSSQPGVRFCWEGREVFWQMSRIFRNLKAIPLNLLENQKEVLQKSFRNLKEFLQKNFRNLKEIFQKTFRNQKKIVQHSERYPLENL